ncbi:MAG: glycosyltransferase family 4 protein [Lewinellaceae bacterium]|nr:glycosyltransferase family 4 protein [Lewinella sp.]MCB9279140.1 glycosyltransferase family 4 protein [Lewinellaceae bacterium]
MKEQAGTIFVFILPKRGCVDYALEMTRHLTRLRYEVYASKQSEGAFPDHTIRVKTFRNGPDFVFSSLFILPRLLLRIARQARRNQCSAFYFPTFHHWAPFFLLLAKRLGIPGIVTVHDAHSHPGEPALLQDLFQRWSVRLAAGVVFLSEYVAGQSNPAGKPIKVIPHGILSLPGLIPGERQGQKPLRLLVIGRIARYKGIDLLEQAIELLEDDLWSSLTIAGAVVDPDFHPFVHPKVHWETGWLPPERMADLLNRADVLVLPYREASQSGVLTLGIAARIPMVVTNVGGLREQLDEQCALWVEPNPESLAEGIGNLAKNPDIYHRIRQNLGENHATATWSQCAEMLEEFIFDQLRQNNHV